MESLGKRPLRHLLRLEAAATRSSGTEIKTIVTDLSLYGCGLIGCFQQGERLSIKIPKIGKLMAEIRWFVTGRAGARFITSALRTP